jgi:type I restriction enzyme M protein
MRPIFDGRNGFALSGTGILRDDGLSYGDYFEQLTFRLLMKMADEQAKPPFDKPSPIHKGFGWDVLLVRQIV